MIMDAKKLCSKIAAFLSDFGSVFLLLLQVTIFMKITSVRANTDEGKKQDKF